MAILVGLCLLHALSLAFSVSLGICSECSQFSVQKWRARTFIRTESCAREQSITRNFLVFVFDVAVR